MKKSLKTTRWKLLIYPRIQLTIIVVNLLLVLLYLLVVAAYIHGMFLHFEQMGVSIGLAEGSQYFRLIELQRQTMLWNLAVPMMVILALSFLFNLLVSHKICGPIVRLVSFFTRLQEGEKFVPLLFRRYDFFKELADAINRYFRRPHP